jgi:hypothetical protein
MAVADEAYTNMGVLHNMLPGTVELGKASLTGLRGSASVQPSTNKQLSEKVKDLAHAPTGRG